MRREAWKIFNEISRQPLKVFRLIAVEKEITKERNDIYKTLLFPLKSTSMIAD